MMYLQKCLKIKNLHRNPNPIFPVLLNFVGKIPVCPGVIAFGMSLRECKNELRSTLEDWILLGLKLGHPLPVVDNINLNQEPTIEPMDTL